MAKTKDGQKFERIPGYTRKGPNGPIKVPPHIRSNPKTSKGEDK